MGVAVWRGGGDGGVVRCCLCIYDRSPLFFVVVARVWSCVESLLLLFLNGRYVLVGLCVCVWRA